jgi:hypothetical protein
MAFQKGVSGNPGGRAKSRIPRVEEVLKAKDMNPTEELLKLLPDLKPAEQAKVWMELIQYCHAKQKYNPGDQIDAEDLAKLSRDELIKRGEAALEQMKKAG